MPTDADLLICRKCGHAAPAFAMDTTGRCNGCRAEVRRQWGHRAEVRERAPVDAWAAVRASRNALLAASDWTQLGDVPAELAARWRGYRTALRDITEAGDPDGIVWPEPPKE